jgi:hypothetical protein
LSLSRELVNPRLIWRCVLALGQCTGAWASRTRTPVVQEGLAVLETLERTLDDPALRAAWRGTAAVQALHAAWHELVMRFGCRVQARLAGSTAPLGRPLRDDERVEVLWTVDDGLLDAAVLAQQGRAAVRRWRIARLLAEAQAQGSADGIRSARALGVNEPPSSATWRRCAHGRTGAHAARQVSS